MNGARLAGHAGERQPAATCSFQDTAAGYDVGPGSKPRVVTTRRLDEKQRKCVGPSLLCRAPAPDAPELCVDGSTNGDYDGVKKAR